MEPFQTRIRQWAEDRNLIEGSTPLHQMSKLAEEVTELDDALLADDTAGIVDAIGDIQVVLGVICSQLFLSVDDCREAAWEEIKYRKGKMIDGVFVKEEQ
jgi:NTP pyrophosphatase (non-canonical NTP hydrolase)